MIKLGFYEPYGRYGPIKCTVQKDGKLGFSSSACSRMDLDNQRYFRVGFNAENPQDAALYLVPAEEGDDKAFKIGKAGQYYYLRVREILDQRGFQYETGDLEFDIKEVQEKTILYYRLTPRESKRKKRQTTAQ